MSIYDAIRNEYKELRWLAAERLSPSTFAARTYTKLRSYGDEWMDGFEMLVVIMMMVFKFEWKKYNKYIDGDDVSHIIITFYYFPSFSFSVIFWRHNFLLSFASSLAWLSLT